jgi:autotransporter-associated beta strand protein
MKASMKTLQNNQRNQFVILLGIIVFMLFTVSTVQAQYTWVGTTGDINTASNWNPSGVPSSGSTCTFTNTGITTTVTGNPAPGVLIVVNSSAGVKDYTISGVLSGATTVTKNGSSTLTLTGTNTYTGITNVNAGTLNIQNSSALGTTSNGTVVATGAKLQLQNNITVTGESLTLYGGNLVSATGGQSVTSYGAYEVRSFTTTGSQTLTFTAGGTVNYLIVGGSGSGGGGIINNVYAAPGGGGDVKTGTFTANAQSYPVNVGRGGVNDGVETTPGEDGVASSLFSVNANGGKGGGTVTAGMGGASGSGQIGGSRNFNTDWVSSSGAGGAGGPGTRGFYTTWGYNGTGGNGGIGIKSDITGVNTGYGGGGAGMSYQGFGTAADGGGGTSYPGPPTANSGGGGAPYTDGAAGIVIVSYINRGALENVSGDNYWTGPVSLATDNTITTTSGTLTIGGIINDNTKSLTKAGAGTLAFGAQAVTINALTVSAGTLISTSGNLSLSGDFTNNGSFTHNNGRVSFVGATSTSVTGTANGNSTHNFYDVTINKAGTATITMPVGVTSQINNSMTLTNGIVNQNGTLNFLNGSSVLGASNASYVNGQVVKFGTQAFTFPVGAGNFYRPVSISAPAVSTDNFTAQYFLTDPSPSYTHTSKDATIDHIGRCEYWILNRTGGSSNVSVTLSWNTTSCGVSHLPELLVARWDAVTNTWKDEGNGGTTGNTTAGTVVTSAPVTSFSPFTLASKTSNNILPIALIDFTAILSDNKVNLNWSTSTETNNKYFTVERSKDGVNFEFVAKVQGAGNSTTPKQYFTQDEKPYQRLSYYRLKQTDFDGQFKYSKIVPINYKGEVLKEIKIYPNPVINELTIELPGKMETIYFEILSSTGAVIYKGNFKQKTTVQTSNFASGTYLIKFSNADTYEFKQVIKK